MPPWSEFLIAERAVLTGTVAMGAKYLPSIKDLKATRRFQQKQTGLPKFKKSSGGGSGSKRKGK